MYVIGLDVGTSGVKSTVFDEKANVVSHAYLEYDLICPGDGMFELDPRELRKKALTVLRQSTKDCTKGEVKAICVTSFGESFVCFDAQGEIIGNTMIYMDKRGEEECKEFLRSFTREEIYDVTGHFVDPMFAVYKMRWLSKNRPEQLKQTKRISFITDFMTYTLGAEHICDYSLAARSGMFDIEQKQWWKPALDFAGIKEEILPKTVPSSSVVGHMSKSVAKELGMTEDVKLILGGHDQVLAAVGSGAQGAGDIANGMGTVDCMISVLNGKTLNKRKMLEYNFPIVPYLEQEDTYVTYAFNMSGGCTIKWFRDTLAKDIAGREDAYALLNEEAPSKPTNILTVPYYAGGGTPYMDAQTPAAISGLRLNTSRGELFRAFMEGESYEMKLNLECLQDAGVDTGKIISVGGGSKSKMWMQLRADMFEQTIYIPSNSEAGTLGSAIFCYTKTGVYDSVKQAQEALISYKSSFEPNTENREQYRKNYEKYKAFYQAVKELYSK